ncbi:MAG: DUF1214 domain-containing protein [Novosphingobium sp.]
MAFGDSPYDRQLFAEWSNFCDKLKSAGMRVFKDANPATALQRVDGFRYLTQNLSQAFDLALETKDTQYPRLLAFCTPTRKLGSDNADCIYVQAWIDGETVYKVSGKKGTARFWNLAVQGPRSAAAYGKTNSRPLHEPFGDTPEVNLFGENLKTNWDGSFELFIGGEKQGQNWLPTTPGSRKLFLRQYFDDWEEEPAEYRIERVGMVTPRPIPTPEQMMEAMRWASDFVYNVVDYWPEWTWATGEAGDPHHPNMFGHAPAPGAIASDQKRGRVVAQMWWELATDEALIVEFPAPHTFWMITSEAVFGNSMDFLYRNISFTPSRTPVDADGKIRLVLTAQDPGYWNWIDNQGYTAGALSFRNVRAAQLPDLNTTVVKVADIAGHMHPGSRKATASDRIDQLQKRFDAILRRYKLG